jgi:hypothetical protein
VDANVGFNVAVAGATETRVGRVVGVYVIIRGLSVTVGSADPAEVGAIVSDGAAAIGMMVVASAEGCAAVDASVAIVVGVLVGNTVGGAVVVGDAVGSTEGVRVGAAVVGPCVVVAAVVACVVAAVVAPVVPLTATAVPTGDTLTWEF